MPNTTSAIRDGSDEPHASHCRLGLGLVLATAALAASACGGGGSQSVPEGSIAVVDGTEISKAELDSLIAQAKKGYAAAEAASSRRSGRPSSRASRRSTSRISSQREEFRQAAAELGIRGHAEGRRHGREGPHQVPLRAASAPSTSKALEAAGLHARVVPCDDARRPRSCRRRSSTQVTKDVAVTSRTSSPTTRTNQSQYGTPESRDVRHILISMKDAKGRRRLRDEQGEGGPDLRGAEVRRRLRGAREGELGRSREQGHGRQAHDLARADGARVRQGLVRARRRVRSRSP